MDELLELREWVTEQLEETRKKKMANLFPCFQEELQVEVIVWEKILKKLNEMILNY